MKKLYIVMYHYTRDLLHSRYPYIKGMDILQFGQQIEFLKNNFSIITMEQVLEAVTHGTDLLPENPVLLTFDDGYMDHYTYAFPILEEYKVQGSFFIPGKVIETHQLLDVNKIHYILASGNIRDLLSDVEERMDYYRGQEFEYPSNNELFEKYAVANRFDGKEVVFVKRILQTVLPEALRSRIADDLFEKYVGISQEQLACELYMTRNQIKTMKRHGMFIGIHGYDHYWLGNLPAEQMQTDILRALDIMDEFIDRKCWVINYPYGNYNQDVLEFAKAEGACLGLTTQVRRVDLDYDSPLELPRLDCNDFPPKSENYETM